MSEGLFQITFPDAKRDAGGETLSESSTTLLKSNKSTAVKVYKEEWSVVSGSPLKKLIPFPYPSL